MFSQFRVEKPCKQCSVDQRQNKWCCKRIEKPSRATARQQRDLQALELRLPVHIPNSTLLEHIATASFFHHYVSHDNTFYRLQLDCLSPVIENAQNRRKLTSVIVAMGILTLPRRSSSSVLAARLRYTKALKLTNEALADPNRAKTDEALLSVILLGLYETTPDEEHSSSSWNAHLDGARLLLQLHGLDRLRRRPAFKLFSALRLQIVLNCFMKSQRIPPDLPEMSNQLSEDQGPYEQAAGKLIALFGRLCALLSDGKTADDTSRSYLITQAEVLDDDFVDWATTLPDGFAYFNQTTGSPNQACHDSIAIYLSVFSCEVWNLYRAGRISVNALIAKHCGIVEQQHLEQTISAAGGPASARQQAKAKLNPAFSKRERRLAIIADIRRDLCDSIPYCMAMHEDPSKRLSELPLHCRTLVMHNLHFLIQTGNSEDDEMTGWAERLLASMQLDSEVDQGAIWMNRPQTVEGTQRLALRDH